jgi:hypothetical protein
MSRRQIHYTWRKDEEWFPVPRTKYSRLACCDCGLVHRIVARVTKTGRVFLAALRDEQESARVRHKFKRQFVMRPSRAPRPEGQP